MFAGIKLLWLVAGKGLAGITIQLDGFNPFDEPGDPGPPATCRFLRQLRLNDINSSVPRASGVSHILDDEAHDDSSDDDGDNSDAGLSRLRVDNEADVKVSEQRAQVDDAGSQPEETSATDAPIQDATLVNGTGLLHVVEPPTAVIEMEAVNPPVEVDMEERPPPVDVEMEAMNPHVEVGMEERPPVADLDMTDAELPADDDLDMGDEDSASDDDVQIEAFAQVLEAAKIEAKMEDLRRPHRPLPPTPVSPAAGTFNAGSFSLGNTGRDQSRGNPGAPLHQVNADEDGSSDDDEFDELANDIEAGLKNDACIPADNSDAGGNGRAGGEQAANKQDDSAQVDSTQTDKAQVQKVQTDSEWDDIEQEYSEQPDDEQIDYEKVENVLQLYNSLSRFEQDWLMDQALSGNEAAYTAPAATGATAFSFNCARVSAEEVLGLYNGLSDEERPGLVDRMAPEE
ncbi:hypothetical protein GGI13_003828 [Coemansia sp. RSA 455]|nr:hypothetical protein GGI13_003828 [Coemansia sp. RSA 455]